MLYDKAILANSINHVKWFLIKMDTLGRRIKFARERLGWNQSKFAQELGLKSPMAVSKYEMNQREPDISKLVKIAKLGNISLDWLLTGEEAPSAALPGGGPTYPPEVQRYVDKLVAIITGPDQKQAGKLEERIDIIYEETRAERERIKKGA